MNLEESASAMLGAVTDLVKKGIIPQTALPAVQQIINKVAGNSIAARFMTKDQALIVANMENLPDETKIKWRNKQLRYYDSVKYVRKDISSKSGMLEIFTDDLDKVVGVTNVSKGKLDTGEVLNIRRIELMYDNGSGITTKTADLAPLAATDDNALLNGEVEVKIGGATVLKVPTNAFTQPDQTVQGSQANGFNLKAPILVDDKRDIQIIVHFAATVASAGGTSDILEFKLIGAGLRQRVW